MQSFLGKRITPQTPPEELAALGEAGRLMQSKAYRDAGDISHATTVARVQDLMRVGFPEPKDTTVQESPPPASAPQAASAPQPGDLHEEARNLIAQQIAAHVNAVGPAAARASALDVRDLLPDWVSRHLPDWARRKGPPAAPPEMSWDEELQRRTARGHLLQLFGQFPDTTNSPDRAQMVNDALRQGSVILSPKLNQFPEDPSTNHVQLPVDPDRTSGTVVVVSPYGPRHMDNAPPGLMEFHPGIDFRNRDRASPLRVLSPKNGTILRIEPNALKGGNQIFVLHDDGSISGFSHTGTLQGVEEGDEVHSGQQIGVSDGSGTIKMHTHYSYYPPGTPIDPQTRKPINTGEHDLSAGTRSPVDPFATVFQNFVPGRDYRYETGRRSP